MSKSKGTSLWKIVFGVLIAAGIKHGLRGGRRLAWRWRRLLTPLWVGFGVWLLAVLVRWNWSGWWWVVLVLPALGTSLAVLGPQLTDRVRTVVMVLVPEGLDRGKDGVLDRPAERTYLAVLLTYVGAYLALRIGAGGSGLSAGVWCFGVLVLGGIWWWHRRVRVAGRADKYARKWGKIQRGETKAIELRALEGSKPVKVLSVGSIAKLRIRLAAGMTPMTVTRAVDALASYYGLRPGAVFAHADDDSGRHVWFTFLPKDPWKGKLTHPMPEPGSTTLREMGYRFTMGLLADATELVYKLQHTLIVGQSGSGKSVWLESLMIWLLAPRDAVLVGIDMAGGATLGMWRRVLALPLATDLDSARWTLERVLAVIEDRERQLGLAKEGGSDDDEFQASEDHPWLVLVIDEFADLIAAGGKEVITLLGRIAKRARKCGARLVFLSQNGSKDDLGSKEMQAQLKALVGLGLDEHESKVLWGPSLTRQGWVSTHLKNGQYLLRDEEHTTPAIAKGFYVHARDRRAIIATAATSRPVLEPSAWAALTGTEGIIIDMPTEEPEDVLDEILGILAESGPRRAEDLAALPGMPSRATVFRRLRLHAEHGRCYSQDGVWHYGPDPARKTA